MSAMKNKNIRTYYKILKGLFLNIDFKEGRFLKDSKNQLKEYELLHPDCTLQEVEEMFGTPQQVYAEYIGEQDTEYLLRAINKRILKKHLLGAVICIIIGCILVRSLFYYSLYIEVRDTIIVETETIIE